MLAEEAHYMGEPCWHVCEYYRLMRQARLERGKSDLARQMRARPYQERVALPVNLPCFECHNRYGHNATCSKYHAALRLV